MNTAVQTLVAAGLGAGLMYLLDPAGGRRRRSLVRDQVRSMLVQTGDAVDVTGRDMRNRAQGVVAEIRSLLRDDGPVSDDLLLRRVRSRIGEVTGHAGGLEATVSDGRVTPSMSMLPRSGSTTPPRIFISVDLPAPFSPTRPITSPGATARLTSSSATTPG